MSPNDSNDPYAPHGQTPHYVPPHQPQPPVNPNPAPPNNPPHQPGQDYSFIMNPSAPPKRPVKLPGSDSLLGRVAVVAGGLIVLIIIFAIVKSLLGGNNFSDFVTVAQDQQAMVHLATDATAQDQQTALQVNTENFAYTTQLSLTSAQTGLLTYLQNNGQKPSANTLNLRVSSALDSQLTTAAADSTYDSTFQQIMKTQLDTYAQDLKRAYITAGPNGRKLLSNDYNGAVLLLQQLNSPDS